MPSSRVPAASLAVRTPRRAVQRAPRRVPAAPASVRIAPARVQTVIARVPFAPPGVQRVSSAMQRASARVQCARSRVDRARSRELDAYDNCLCSTLRPPQQLHERTTPADNRELARTHCFDRMSAFGKAHATDIADVAADSDGRKKAKAKARAKFIELDTLNIAIGKEVAKQQSGGRAIGTTNRGVLRDALTGDLRE